jgi:cyclohexanone monooxygenase
MEQTWGFDMMDSKQMYDAIKEDPAEVQRILEGGWEKGGFRYFFETFADLLISDESNREIAEFIRRKIKAIVKDPKTAELLCPQYPVVTKRPPLGHNYYEAYNRPNVRLVNIKNDPIQDVTTTGLKTGSEEFEFDMIIFALGKIAPR